MEEDFMLMNNKLLRLLDGGCLPRRKATPKARRERERCAGMDIKNLLNYLITACIVLIALGIICLVSFVGIERPTEDVWLFDTTLMFSVISLFVLGLTMSIGIKNAIHSSILEEWTASPHSILSLLYFLFTTIIVPIFVSSRLLGDDLKIGGHYTGYVVFHSVVFGLFVIVHLLMIMAERDAADD